MEKTSLFFEPKAPASDSNQTENSNPSAAFPGWLVLNKQWLEEKPQIPFSSDRVKMCAPQDHTVCITQSLLARIFHSQI